MTEEETSKNLEILTAKIDELSKEIKERKEYTEWKMKDKIDELSKEIKEREGKIKERKEAHEEKIRENPLASLAGAFAGGLIVGYLIEKGKS